MQRRAAETRDRLLDAAAAVLDARGYDGASLADILDSAGLTKGALYHHFPSKAALVRALIDDQFSPELAKPAVADLPLVHVAEVTVQAMIAAAEDVRFRAAFGVIVDRPHADLGPVDRPIEEWTRTFSGLFRDAAQRGHLGDGIAPPAAARSVVAEVIGQFCLARSATTERSGVAATAEFWRGFFGQCVPPRWRDEHLRAVDVILERHASPDQR
ncbi:TetR/AcrR family transcriptional regulator [Tsukamurella sp. 1534]|uniref:TetR/AcrR family transcriptional regulator n=1 Tax=Tsukamurella sp. 1534 TaxID=1151061 RepID=UPI0002EBC03B|nr:TetR/AcrR family transcriptional regulator [Tsukamurella sp. 1534]